MHNEGRGGCEIMYSLYHLIKERLLGQNPALRNPPWESFTELLRKTAHKKFKFDAFLGPTTDKVMKDMYELALRASPPDVDLLPTVKQVADQLDIGASQFSRMTKIGYQNHHTVPKYVQDLLFQLDEVDRDSVPSLLLSQLDHTGANPGPGRGSFHSILYDYIPQRTKRGDMSRAQIVDRLRQAYHDFGRPDVGAVAEQWLKKHGVSAN